MNYIDLVIDLSPSIVNAYILFPSTNNEMYNKNNAYRNIKIRVLYSPIDFFVRYVEVLGV